MVRLIPSPVRGFVAGLMVFLVTAAVGLSGTVRATEPAPPPSGETLFLTGRLLVASPDMGDPRFSHSVVYMVSHDKTGAFGLIINKAYGSGPLRELLKAFDIDPAGVEGTINLHYGGPVSPSAGYVLHTSDYKGPGTHVIDKDFAMTSEMSIMTAIAEGRGPRNSLFSFGYSGWGAGQLESEVQHGDWLSAPADESLIFGDDQQTKWDRAIGKAGLKL
jgi:putative transcriptional regulator